jgi:hypothetical protein
MPYHKYAAKRHKPLIEDFLKMYVKKKYKISYIQKVLAKKHGYEFNSARIIINGAKADRILAERKKKHNTHQTPMPKTASSKSLLTSSQHDTSKPTNQKN